MIDIGIIGSRTYPFEYKVRTLVAGLPWATFPKEFRIISGGAPGPDSWAGEEADLMGYPIMVLKAEWKIYGKGAGMIRNTILVDSCHMIFAFWDGISRGTRHAIRYAKEQKVPYTIIGVDDVRI